MNPAQFLSHFDRISDAPDAIPRLRRFILDLAVRGKLVQRDSRDEPASELLKRIQTEKAQSIYERRARKSKDALAQSYIPFNVPADWEWVPFGEIVRIRTGKLDANAAVIGGAYPFFTCSQTPSEIDSYSFDTSAVLLAGNGDFNLKCYQGKFDAYQRTYVIEPLGWDLHFCFILMKSQISRITENQRGSAIPYLKLGDIADAVVPLPALAEQRRIVAKVDELMALCDRLEAAQAERENRRDRLVASSLNRLNNGAGPDGFRNHARFYFNHLPRLTTRTEHIQQLRQTILNLVVRGKLVPQDPNDEPASELLKKIEQTKRQLIAARELRQGSSITNSIDRRSEISIPKSWAWTKCDKILFVTKLAGFEYTKHFELSSEGDIPVIRAQNVRPWRIDRNNLLYIDNKTSETLERSALTKPCILVTFIGAGIGDVAFFNEELRWHLAPNVAKAEVFIGCEDLLDLRYLVLFLNSPFGRAEIFKHMKSTAQPSISMGTIRDIDLAIPPLAEQQRIVAKVEELMALCDKLDAQLTTTHIDNSRLLEAVLAEQLHHDVAPMGG